MRKCGDSASDVVGGTSGASVAGGDSTGVVRIAVASPFPLRIVPERFGAAAKSGTAVGACCPSASWRDFHSSKESRRSSSTGSSGASGDFSPHEEQPNGYCGGTTADWMAFNGHQPTMGFPANPGYFAQQQPPPSGQYGQT